MVGDMYTVAMADQSIWAEQAPQYKKDGEMYATIEYDDNGDPDLIRVAKNQLRRGEFRVEGSTAVYIPNNMPTLPKAGDEEKQYVEQLPFVQAVDMGDE